MTASTANTPDAPAKHAAHHLGLRLLGAVLALAIVVIHVKDQGGFPGDKTPTYVGIGYYLIEAVGIVLAFALITGLGRHTVKVWLMTLGVAVGPLAGFVLSRGPGLPDYTDDRGNWTEPIGVASLVVEGALVLLATTVLARSRHAADDTR
jgi:hypothetical protein